MCDSFCCLAKEIEIKLSKDPLAAEMLLDELNTAFFHLLDDFNMALDEERDFLRHIQAQRLFHVVGSKIINQIINPTGAGNVVISDHPTSAIQSQAPSIPTGAIAKPQVIANVPIKPEPVVAEMANFLPYRDHVRLMDRFTMCGHSSRSPNAGSNAF